MSGTKNLGQVAGVFVGTTPPENTKLIWWDSTPSQQKHKVYDISLTQWVNLAPDVISSVTLSEVTNMASNPGLTVGSWFKITDLGNVLALAITPTKIQYSDNLGNILVNDLGSNIQYHVTSSNLLIDDIAGVFDTVNKKLVFTFNESSNIVVADDFLLAKIKRSNVWYLAKIKFSTLLSSVSGNSLTWNSGIFFSFSTAISNIINKVGGVVGYDSYTNTINEITQSIANVGTANQEIIENAENYINMKTTPSAIYGKAIPSIPNLSSEPIDAVAGDTLTNIVSKFQRYINKFKYATGIRLSAAFAPSVTVTPINNNDTVESALAKTQAFMDSIGSGSIPELTKKVIYDYVVDSDATLAGLRNNTTATKVLIKNGTWTYDHGSSDEHLFILGNNIKLIDCEPEALVKVKITLANRPNSVRLSVFARASQDSVTERIYGLRVSMEGVGTVNNQFVNYTAFSQLRNLEKCETVSQVGQIAPQGFVNCNNLKECRCLNGSSWDGFYGCNNLTSCNVERVDDKDASLGFYGCNRLIGCSVTGSETDGENCFSVCKDVANCFVDLVHKNNGNSIVGFVSCERVINCRASINKASIYTGALAFFETCLFISQCYAENLSGTSPTNTRGFSDCRVISSCHAKGFAADKSFPGSQPAYSLDATDTCSDTAGGGFNSFS